MASVLKVNTLTGVTTAGSIVVTGEGNSTTTSLQQGLVKVWHHGSSDGATLEDSFNAGSLTDTGTGQQTVNLTNNMANANYAVQNAIHFGQTRFVFCESVATSSYTNSAYLADNSAYADAHQNSQVTGDLA